MATGNVDPLAGGTHAGARTQMSQNSHPQPLEDGLGAVLNFKRKHKNAIIRP